jgi:hypothetical protein
MLVPLSNYLYNKYLNLPPIGVFVLPIPNMLKN